MGQYLAIFHGVDASGGPANVPDNIAQAVPGHRIVNVINMNTYLDATNGFVPLILADGVIVQDNGLDWSAFTFIALIERP